MTKSTIVDVNWKLWGDEYIYQIRKRNVEIKAEMGQVLGFDFETIKKLDKK